LSSHIDVVPASEPEWSADQLVLRRGGDRLCGRRTTDMKGLLACTLAALPQLAASNMRQPMHLAFSYDEEASCRGIPHLVAAHPRHCVKRLSTVIDKPSRIQAVRAHNGKAAVRPEVTGRLGHPPRPDPGLNAVYAMAYGESLTDGPFDHSFAAPYSSLQVGVVAGSQTVNIVPDCCIADIEVRAVPGVSPSSLLEPVKAQLFALRDGGFVVAWHELNAYPALSLAEGSELAALLVELTGQEPLVAVSFGTEAGLYQQVGIDAIICAPGDIDPNEYSKIGELAACQTMIKDLGVRLAA
jgi:acetylornithine deacetylase